MTKHSDMVKGFMGVLSERFGHNEAFTNFKFADTCLGMLGRNHIDDDERDFLCSLAGKDTATRIIEAYT
ncbi:hypothetical protein [Enterovibrio baiacu]|uniref:hypothetical protein n=1 Tax=Enterovibrio baiacu TaxID=2491023 RepID=UPI0010132295|nr:hypothetical protein [Enterovibrio baiacu]MBE1275093.1 hypothetical protein [Enterovibrio baiacu]